jgi:hypothetical protein
LSIRAKRSRPFAPVRWSLQIGAFAFVTFAATAPERTVGAANAAKDFDVIGRRPKPTTMARPPRSGYRLS